MGVISLGVFSLHAWVVDKESEIAPAMFQENRLKMSEGDRPDRPEVKASGQRGSARILPPISTGDALPSIREVLDVADLPDEIAGDGGRQPTLQLGTLIRNATTVQLRS
jgi:hypothetical protein